MSAELEAFLGEPDSWRRAAFRIISDIPPGHLANYGRVAALLNEQGYSAHARNVAHLRRRLYEVFGHETDVPLHRVAKKGDVHSIHDSEKTRRINGVKRQAEGTLAHPRWM